MEMLILAGTVTKDAQLRKTQNGENVLSFSIVIDQGKDSSGERRPGRFYDASLWGPRAEKLQRHITKGSKLTLTGRPSARAHDGKAYLGITVNDLTFMGGGQERREERPEQEPQRQQSGSGGSYAGGGIEDEIPF